MTSPQWLGVALLSGAGWVFTAHAAAAECGVTVETGDNLKFDEEVITVDPSCKEFKVTLVHNGKLPENVMGHNWVLSAAGDVAAIAADGMKAGLQNEYLKPDEARVIAHTELIGGGEETSVSFATDKLEATEEYVFFCSFPGHSTVMRGTLALRKDQG